MRVSIPPGTDEGEVLKVSSLVAMEYGIPKEVAERNIQVRDTIEDYPEFLLRMDYPVFHITYPPYLYLGYIMMHEETRKYL